MHHSLFKAVSFALCCSSMAMNPIITQEEVDKANLKLDPSVGSDKFVQAIELTKEMAQSHYKNTNCADWQFIRSDYQVKELNSQQQRAEMQERKLFLKAVHKAHDLFSSVHIILLNTHNFPIPVVQYNQSKYEAFVGLQKTIIDKAVKAIEDSEIHRANKAILAATMDCANDIDRITNRYRRICTHIFFWAAIGWGTVAYQGYFKQLLFDANFKR